MNPQYANQQPPGGYNNPGYRMPPSSQAPQGYGAFPPGPGQPYGGAPNPAAAMGAPPQPTGPPGRFGGPAPSGQPNGQQNLFNGPSQQSMGPPGQFGAAPSKMAGQPPVTGPPSMTNGPPSGPLPPQGGPGVQGQPTAHTGHRGPTPTNQGPPPRPPSANQQVPGPTAGNQPPPGPPRPMGGQFSPPPASHPQGAPQTNQLSNQMGAMNLGPGNMVPRPGLPGQPTSPQAPPPLRGPATSRGPSQMQPPPPRPGFPQRMDGPAQVNSAPPQGPTGFPPAPPSSVAGYPHSSMPSQPPSVGSQPGFPPMAGSFPPSSTTGGFPPSSMAGGFPPSSMGGQQGYPQPPPSSVGNQSGFPPQTSMPGMAGYAQGSMGMMPPGGSLPNAGPPSSLPNQYPAPPGGMPPPPSPGGSFPGTQGAGYPAQRQGMPNAAPGMSAPTQPQQPRRLDPDQMPSPIQVIEDDQRNHSGEFSTGQKGTVPPLVTTEFVVEDRGNATPCMMRSTMYNIPCTNDMMKQAHLPFILAFTPFARFAPNENPLPIVDLGPLGPVRCNRCKAYMNPYMQFMDGGRRFQCCFCGCSTEVPPEYFAHLDHTGRRVDSYDRPELCLGSYEFVATTDYCKNNVLPKPPAYIFMIDVSYNAVKSGLVNLLCQHLKDDILVNLPKELGMEESEIRVGFVTYGKDLQFYNVKGNLAQPQMLVVSDVQDVFVPLVDGFLVKLSESEAVIDSLLAQIPQTFAESRETEIVLGPVIEAGLDALKASDRTGKLIIFHTSLPIAEAPGKLKNRDDRKLLGTDKEKTILMPQSNYYTKLGQDCVAAGCGVDLFLFPNAYIDIASVAEVPRLTGGNIFKYSYFQADLDGQRLIEDLKANVMRPIGFDCIMRVRTSTGIRPVDFLGNFYMANTTDVELANMDCDKTVTVEVKHDDKLSEADGAYIQAAILYTSVSGQRRLRILNMTYNCCSQMADLFRNCELDTLVNYMAKIAIRESMNANPKAVRETIMNRCAQILACYRKNCASPSSAGQLILPECMKLLPLYSNCIIKSQALQGAAEVSTDDRSYLIHCVNSMSIKDSQVFFYPKLIPLHDLDPNDEDPAVPVAIRCSYERLKDTGIYLIENGLTMLMWIGLNVPTEWVVGLFGVQSAAQIDIDQTRLQDLDTTRSRQVRSIVQKIRQQRLRHLKLVIVRQRDKLEPVFQQYLVEDRSTGGSASYVDFLCHIHKEIRSLLS